MGICQLFLSAAPFVVDGVGDAVHAARWLTAHRSHFSFLGAPHTVDPATEPRPEGWVGAACHRPAAPSSRPPYVILVDVVVE